MKIPDKKTLDEKRKEGMRPGFIACFVNDGKLLFVYTKDWDLWQLPQGGIETGETLKEALQRDMKEELQVSFIEETDIDLEVFGQDHLEFPKSKVKDKKLKTESGEEFQMKGKHYYFTLITTKQRFLDIEKTDFDQYAWLNKLESEEIVEEIQQTGKQRVTKQILHILNQKDVLK